MKSFLTLGLLVLTACSVQEEGLTYELTADPEVTKPGGQVFINCQVDCMDAYDSVYYKWSSYDLETGEAHWWPWQDKTVGSFTWVPIMSNKDYATVFVVEISAWQADSLFVGLDSLAVFVDCGGGL